MANGGFQSDAFQNDAFQTEEAAPPIPPIISGTTNALDDILNEYPEIFDKRVGSNHYNYHSVIGEVLDLFSRDQLLVQLAGNLDRPFKIWKQQGIPYNYQINYQINLPNLQEVQLYLQGDSPTLIQDSGILPEGTTNYEGNYNTSSSSIIPTEQYYITVTDTNGNVFQKGIPENDISQGDIYDHDNALDVFGLKWGIPRRTYNTTINPTEYGNTVPPFFINETEADYDYEQRIWQFIDNYKNLPLALTEIEKDLSFSPRLTGRWRETGLITDSPIFDIIGILEEIPSNINFGTQENCQAIIDRCSPAGKKGFMNLISINPAYNKNDIMGLNDSLNFNINFDIENSFLNEHLTFNMNVLIEKSNLSLEESVTKMITSPFICNSTDSLIPINVDTPILQTLLGATVFGNSNTGVLFDLYCEPFFY